MVCSAQCVCVRVCVCVWLAQCGKDTPKHHWACLVPHTDQPKLARRNRVKLHKVYIAAL